MLILTLAKTKHVVAEEPDISQEVVETKAEL